MRQSRCRSSVLAATAVAIVLVASGCGGEVASVSDSAESGTASYPVSTVPVAGHHSTGAAGPQETAQAGMTPNETASSDLSTESSEIPDATTSVDALTLTGPATAATVPDMQSVVTDPQPHLPHTVTDSRGKRITVTSAHRVIALDLYGTLVDTIIGLGLQDRLVGRGVSDTQAALADLPVVSSGGIELNVEAVLSLDPDLIVTNMTIGSVENYRQLEAAGVTVVRFDRVPSMDTIGESMTAVAAVFGMAEQAEPLVQRTEQQMDKARQQVERLAAATPRPPRALVVYVRGTAGLFFILGADYGVSDLLDALQLDDSAADAGIESLTPANPEALAALDPEIILTMTDGVESGGGIDALLARPGIASTTAGQHRRIITAEDSQLLSYGPRTPANLVALADVIYGSSR